MSMRLIPYAGTERPRPRRMSDKDRRAAMLANIFVRQKQGRLLSEIGAEFGLEIVCQTVLTWLSAPQESERKGNKCAQQCTTASRKYSRRWHGEQTTPESVP